MANNIDQLYGDYASDVMEDFARTPLVGLLPLGDHVAYAAGCMHNHSTVCQVCTYGHMRNLRSVPLIKVAGQVDQ